MKQDEKELCKNPEISESTRRVAKRGVHRLRSNIMEVDLCLYVECKTFCIANKKKYSESKN